MSGTIDARAYSGPPEIDCDLCIAGAGAAGITLAFKLARPGRRVVLLESGGFEFDGETQGLCRGRTTGLPYYSLTSSRLRFFGGTTSHWGANCRMPSRIDLESRPALGLPGWPIDYDELMSYAPPAAAWLGIEFHADPLAHPGTAPADPALAVDGRSDVLRSHVRRRSPPESRHFNRRFRHEIGALHDTDVFLYANLTHIGLAENGATVRSLTARTLTGKTLVVRPRAAVLACHAIENARLLLASNDVIGAGIGNAGDHVGRNFMDHVSVNSGRLVPSTGRLLDFYYAADPISPLAHRLVGAHFGFKDEFLRDSEMLQYQCSLRAHFAPPVELTGEAAGRLSKAFFEPFDMQAARDVATLLEHPVSAASSVAARLGLVKRTPAYFELSQTIEPSPNPDSRVTLMAERDALGVPTVSLHWALSEIDYAKFARAQEIFMAEASALGLGRFAAEPLSRELIERIVVGGFHHMGTTRMSASPAAGVVDADCRVHGTHNLFVAGSGVFPSATSAGPTMTIVALALRLAGHLDAKVLA